MEKREIKMKLFLSVINVIEILSGKVKMLKLLKNHLRMIIKQGEQTEELYNVNFKM